MLDDGGKDGGTDHGKLLRQAKDTAQPLSVRVKKLSRALKESACGPLIVARDVVRIIDNWDLHRKESGGVTPSQWSRKNFGKGFGCVAIALRKWKG